MKRKAFAALLSMIIILACPQVYAAAAPQRLEPSALLNRLEQTRPKHLDAEAAAQVRINYQNSRKLCLDLIFYNWVLRTIDSENGVDRLDEIVSALSEHMVDVDSGVGWANSVLRGTGSKRGMLDLKDEKIIPLAELRDTIRLGISNRERSPIRAADVLGQAVSMCSRMNLDLTGAVILTVLGDQYFGMDRYQEAEDCYERARGVFREYRAKVNLARVYEDLGTLYSNMRNYAVAAESFKSSGIEWKSLKRGDAAGEQFIQAGVALAAHGRRERAIELIMDGYNESRDWAIVHKSYGQLVKNSRDVGDFFLTQGDILGARDIYRAAANYAETAGNREAQARALKELIEVYNQIGDTEAANDAKEAAAKRSLVLNKAVRDCQSAVLKTSQKTGINVGESERLLPIIMLGGWASSELGNHKQAEDFYRHAAGLYHKLGKAKEAVDALEAVAASLEARGEEDMALTARLEAITDAESIDSGSDLTADAKARVAEDYISSGKLDMAVTVLGQCESIYRFSGTVRQLAVVLQKRGDLHLQRKEYDKAAADYREAANIYLGDMGEPWTAAQAFWKLADALEAGGHEKEIPEILATAINQVERWCTEQSIDPDLEPLGSQILSLLYGRLIPIQISSGEKQKAWEFLRASERYRWHQTLLTSLRSSEDQAVDALMDEYEQSIQTKLIRPKKQGEVKQVAKDWAETVNYIFLLKKWYPMQYRSMRVDPQVISKLAPLIPDGVAVIDYLFTDTASYAFIITRSGSSLWQLSATRQQVEELARRFEQVVEDSQDTIETGMPLPSDWKSDDLKPLREASTGLYTSLIEPIRSQFSGIKSLAFASPSEVSGFPMHALAYIQPDGNPRFLIEDFSVGYVGPNSLLDLISPNVRQVDPAKDKLAIFADPAGNLPGASEEAEFIRSSYANSESYIREKARKDTFAIASKSCAILHIAAHHQLDPDMSQFSISLAPGAASDGVVRMSDLYEAGNTGVSLIVLSMCEALGSTNAAVDREPIVAELLSVARIPSVIGTQWKVSDQASSKLMDELYRALAAKNCSRAEALKKAQQSLIASEKFKHPYYWAAFSLYGNQN